ncbi:MAG: response regulator transcription factor [Candidatus Limnocylindrales bacterium]|jgi:two-component system KDP operon response regulator KdpE
MTAADTEGRPAGARHVLVVEDEPEFASLLCLWLERHGWEAIVANDCPRALAIFEAQEPDIVLLDIGLPGVDGWQALERIRATSRVPVLLVTARGTEAERIHGLSLGADDYITKPLSFPELMARIEAALRRAHPADDMSGTSIRRGRLLLDPVRHRVQVSGVEIHLTPTEFRLLEHLAAQPDRVVSHRELLAAVWGAGYEDETHLLQVTVRNLRAKLAAVIQDSVIGTVYGMGYRIVEK